MLPISIVSLASLSPLGKTPEETCQAYKSPEHCFSEKEGNLVAGMSKELKKEIEELRLSDIKFKALDDSVLFAIYASRRAVDQAGWKASDNFGINIGSSRGATSLFEKHHADFLNNSKLNPLSSPTTTLGNISSWVAHDLQTQGPEISHSITCSTALHALLNGIAWLNSGMCNKFLVGGSEAPLTPFTIAQMQAIKIYCPSERSEEAYPCAALNLDKKKNTMILGEAASMACLEKGNQPKAIAKIVGVGYATEILEHNASLSTDAVCFQRSMKMALGSLSPNEVDVIVTHTPGTIKGDMSEVKAIKSLFTEKQPALTTNKWKLGHSLGASGMLNIEMAVLMLMHHEFIPVPYLKQDVPKNIKYILVNAVGFGGNAVSILLTK